MANSTGIYNAYKISGLKGGRLRRQRIDNLRDKANEEMMIRYSNRFYDPFYYELIYREIQKNS